MILRQWLGSSMLKLDLVTPLSLDKKMKRNKWTELQEDNNYNKLIIFKGIISYTEDQLLLGQDLELWDKVLMSEGLRILVKLTCKDKVVLLKKRGTRERLWYLIKMLWIFLGILLDLRGIRVSKSKRLRIINQHHKTDHNLILASLKGLALFKIKDQDNHQQAIQKNKSSRCSIMVSLVQLGVPVNNKNW